MTRTVFFIPALKKMSGGLANIYTVARNLADAGRDVALMGPSVDAAGLKEAEADGLAVLPWGAALASSDIWCIPESWPNALSVGVNAGARVLVYVQNWIYMLGTLPDGVRWKQLPLEYAAVSRPVAWFMREVLGLESRGVVPPVIDAAFFRQERKAAAPVRVAYMPRKNRALADQIRNVAAACLAEREKAPRVEWVEINNRTRAEVAELLSSCHLFISTGFPEGFGLPPLEAMATGCVPVGFTGFGGWEYMRQAPDNGPDAGSVPAHMPPFSLASAAQGACGNGFFFADGDTLGAGLALARAVLRAHENGGDWQRLCASCRRTAEAYTNAAQQEALLRVFPV